MPQGLLPSHFSSEHPHQRYLDNKPSFLTRLKRRFFYVLDGNPRRLKSISLLLLTVCIAFYLVFFAFVNDAVIEEAPNIVLPDSLLEKRVDFKRVTIDKICSESTSVCYSVIDEKTDENTVLRHLSFDNGLPEEYDTSVILIPPSGETFDSSDTRIWNIDHRKISSQYVAGMFITPFMLSLLPTEGPAGNKSMLEIGLGGGSLDMAMHTALPDVNITGVELDPVVIKIAEKWFGVAGNDRHRMVAADGVQFVSDMRKRQETTDIVVVDACGGDVDITCPSEGFRTRDAVENLMSILNPSGILIVNVLAHDEKEANPVNVQKAVAAYTDVFPACLQLKMTNELNVILACLTQSIGDVEEQLKFYSKRLDAAVTTFKLEYILGNVSLSKIY